MLRLFVCVAFGALLITASGIAADTSCCRHCCKGKACGNTCINKELTCHKERGCACNRCQRPVVLPVTSAESKQPSEMAESSRRPVPIVKSTRPSPRTQLFGTLLDCLDEFLSRFRR
jgi:hypothetical protein